MGCPWKETIKNEEGEGGGGGGDVNGNALNINPNCLKLKERLKVNSKGRGDVRLCLKVGKNLGLTTQLQAVFSGKEWSSTSNT